MAVVPAGLQVSMQSPAVGTPPRWSTDVVEVDLLVDMAKLRQWSRTGRKLRIAYEDDSGARSERIVHPFLIGYTARVRTVIAWCELRADFRVFRTERLRVIDFLDEHYDGDPLELRARWLATKPAQR